MTTLRPGDGGRSISARVGRAAMAASCCGPNDPKRKGVGRQRPCLHGQGLHRMVSHCLQPDQNATGFRGQPENKANAAHQKAEGYMG